ncbi:MAG: hypothetical protein A3I63_04985 [Betaproteobacteria bacterium RIFCSPLOWO2_02_FULL_66_14]|nr:MAG: hypothetical protein A3I63_04985 [Betaproteobacteria bacterium RIFCSPLOWO2_02_FULL_66_14]
MNEEPLLLSPSPPRRRAHDVHELPERVLQTYARLWQLETWLRRMVYVELRAHLGDDWKSNVKLEKAQLPQKEDKALVHMPTPEEDPLSYVQLSELCRIVSENRRLFDPFLPPAVVWEGRMKEISQVRHRVAHFRQGNERDLDRVVHLLRDLDKGFWKFITSYNCQRHVLPQDGDPVFAHFLPLDLIPFVEVAPREWAQAGSIPHDAWFGVSVAATVRPWAKWTEPVAGHEGIFYDVSIYLRGSRRRYFDYQNLLENTRRLHQHVAHICLEDRADSVRVTIPAILGEQRVIEVLDHMIDMARSSARPGEWPSYKGTIKNVADEWPEYVLEPQHPLTLLTRDMPCSIFEA